MVPSAMQPRTGKLRHRQSAALTGEREQLHMILSYKNKPLRPQPFLSDCKRETCSETLENTEISGLENKASLILAGRSQSPPHWLIGRFWPHQGDRGQRLGTFQVVTGAEGCAAGIGWAVARGAAKYPQGPGRPGTEKDPPQHRQCGG